MKPLEEKFRTIGPSSQVEFIYIHMIHELGYDIDAHEFYEGFNRHSQADH